MTVMYNVINQSNGIKITLFEGNYDYLVWGCGPMVRLLAYHIGARRLFPYKRERVLMRCSPVDIS